MGELLRRLWQPIAAVAELDTPIKPMRLMARNLVLYKTREAATGSRPSLAPTRRADMSYGWWKSAASGATYHGWKYERDRPPASTSHSKR